MRRDGLFLRDFKLLNILGLARAEKEASVILDSPSPEGLRDFLVDRLPSLGRRMVTTDAAKPKPAPWRDTQDHTRVVFIQRQLERLGPCWTFNLHLEYAVIAEAKADAKGFIDFFRRRLSRQLTAALGSPPSFWFAAERTIKGEPHKRRLWPCEV
jgi:hypothetical protein